MYINIDKKKNVWEDLTLGRICTSTIQRLIVGGEHMGPSPPHTILLTLRHTAIFY